MTAQKSVLFNDYQQQALSALGLPLWQSVAAPATAGTIAEFCYRFDNWLLLTSTRLEPLDLAWHADLLATLMELTGQSKAALVEVSMTSTVSWDSTRLLNLRHQADDHGNLAQLKRALWQQISQSSIA